MSARILRRWTAALAVCALMLAACGTAGDDDDSSSGDTSGGGSESGELGTGVTADTIKVGFSYPDLEKLRETGIVKTDNGPYDEIIKVLVDDVNARGGVGGRKLELTSEAFDVLGAEGALATCTKFTEDEKVFAVLGGFLTDTNLCVSQQHSTILVSGYGTGFNDETVSKARAPWVTWNASDERAVEALVQLLDEQGRLDDKKIAVEGQTPGTQSLVDTTVKAIEDAGYEVADQAIIEIPASDAQAFAAQDKLLAQRFKDKGIDTLFLVGGTPTGANYDAVGWHPSIYVPQTGLVTPGAYTNPFEKFPLIAGVAASADPDAGYNTPEMQRCRDVYTKATGKEIKTMAQETADGKSSGNAAMTGACSALQIFVAAAEAAGENLNQDTWQKGLESIGEVALPAAPIASFGPDKPDAQDSFQLMQHDPNWEPSGTTEEFIPLGDPITLRS
jgi:ABC-type branched-subunit amino acid transport system substrate-binding protein